MKMIYSSLKLCSQTKYSNDILKRFNMNNCKSAPTQIVLGLKLSKDDKRSEIDPISYKILVGSIMYLTTTRLVNNTCTKSYFKVHEIPKRILRYVNGTKNHVIQYSRSNEFKLIGYIETNCAGNIDDKESN